MNYHPKVEHFITDLPVEKREILELIRKVILCNTQVNENFKWNTPVYGLNKRMVLWLRIM